jgi:hypothetical protein
VGAQSLYHSIGERTADTMALKPNNFRMKLNTGNLDEKVAETTIREYADPSLISPISEACLDIVQEKQHSVFRHPKLWWRQNYRSWRFYTTIYAALAMLVTLIVFIATVTAIIVHGIDSNGRITIYEGSCSDMKWSNFFGRLFISGLGTYMLSASAYVMVST